MSGAFPTASHTGYPISGRRSYISIEAFNSYFFSYTTSTGSAPTFTVTGTLAAVSGATASNCPAGRVLRENGKKLYPSANPGVSTLMVGVYDASSGLSGFIDPNDRVFAIYNGDKAYFLDDGVSPVDSATDKGPGVYSLGNIVTREGNITASSGIIAASTVTALTAVTATAARDIDASLGSVYTVNLQFTAATQTLSVTASNVQSGQIVTLIIFANASHTTAGTITFTTNIIAGDITLGTTASRYYTITFIGNGTSLVEIGRAGAAVATGGFA